MAELLARLVHHLRPLEGWPPFLLLLVASLCPAAVLISASDEREGVGMVLLTVLGLVAGLRFARWRLSYRAVALFTGLLGLGLTIVYAGRIVPPLTLIWEEIVYTGDWLQNWRRGIPGWPLPFATAAEFVWQQLNAFGLRLWWWFQTMTAGEPAQDQIAVSMAVLFLAWAFAIFATWQIYQHRAAVLGLAPGALAMVLLAFFRGGLANFYLIVYSFCAVWLVAIIHLWRSTARWQAKGTDYPGDLGVELVISLGPLLVLIFAVAALFPVIYPNQVRDAFWNIMDTPWSRVEEAAERVIGPIEGAAPAAPEPRGGARGELPRVHLLGGRPELADTIVLYAGTSDPPPPTPSPDPDTSREAAGPRRYWRADTWDTYTGLGWANTPLESEPLPANQVLEVDQDRGPSLLQQFQRLVPGDDRIYAANAPRRIDQPVQTWRRVDGELAYLTADSDLYSVVSILPEINSAELRAISPLTATLPAEVRERYLSLPVAVPRRVLDLAQEVVGEAPSYYDRARAIERYLRTYPYNLDIPEPPTDHDLVDYFLFELQEGYCDYYASAMVVMARSVGVPARLASGYVQGTYDDENRRWVVTEQEGHSWVEVYFNAVGWVEFEPTAGRPALVRPDVPNVAELNVPPLPPRQVRSWQQIPWALVMLGTVLAALLALIALLWRPRPALVAAELVRDRHERMLRWGRRMRQPPGRGQTSREYGQVLGRALEVRGQSARLSQIRQAGKEAPAEIEALTEAFEQVQYSARSMSEGEARQVGLLWARLRRRLWWLWLVPGPRATGTDSTPVEEHHES